MRKLAFFLTIAGAILMMGCSEDPMTNPDPTATLKGAKKPMPKLVGTTYEEAGGPGSVGTIDFTGNDGYGIYKIVYEIFEPPAGEGNALHFAEHFKISDLEDDTELMTGTNSGVFIGGQTFLTNGVVHTACGDFDGWEGRRVHVRGEITDYGPPMRLTSTFRIN